MQTVRARLLRDIEHQTENINFSENEHGLLIQGTTGAEYRIKINRIAKNLNEDKFQLSARTDSSEPWGKFVLMLVMNYEIYR